jgi:predicted CxxxxCH...CXXCH cytochrome family protein
MGNNSASGIKYSQVVVGIAALVSLAFGACMAEAASFLNSCTTYCHGASPRDGARKGNPHFGSQSSAFIGNHKNHLSAAPSTNDCSICHAPVPSTGFGHQNNVIDMAVKLKGYSTTTGRARYDKGVFFNMTSVPNLTNATCSNISCHFEKKTPVWGSTAYNVATDCGVCHGAPPAGTTAAPTGGLAGSHTRHDAYFPGTANCQKCHPNSTTFAHATSAGRALKVQGFLRDPLNTLEASGNYSGTAVNYLPSKSVSPAFGTCSNIYCHSTAQSATGAGAGTAVTTAAWGGTTTCGSCHVDMSSSASATGSHIAHAQSSGTVYTCDVCHGTGFSATVVNTANHVNKQINLSFTGNATGTTYVTKGTAFVPGSAVYSSCTTNNCHGAMNPTWGANTAKARCQKCHGYRSSGWNALNGATATTDIKAGAHFNHISSSGSLKFSKAFSCAECHATTIALSTDNVNAAGHIDSVGPAEVTFSNLAKTNSSAPTYTASACANNYCHGANMASNISNPPSSRVVSPTWNAPFLGTASVVGNGSTTPGSGDCSKCHGYPPMSTTHNGKLATACIGCHPHVNASGTGFTDASKHINGVVDGGGVSSGGSPCYTCHSAYNVMNSSAGVFHHVLDAASPDQAPNTGTYPSSQTDLACTSCHTDHNYFNSNKGANLRTSYNAAAGTRDNHDFSTTAPYGLCVSCHSTAQTKSTAQTVAGTTATIVIDGSATGYQASMHNYTASSLFGTSQFSANCVKCHSDEQTKDKQTSAAPDKFGPHYSVQRSLLNPMGATPQAAAGADFCYRCHSKTTDTNPGGGVAKTTALKDYFGSKAMTAAAEDTFSTMQLVNRHNVSSYKGLHKDTETRADIAATKHVECADCHDPHLAKAGKHTAGSAALAGVLTGASGVNVTTWGANWAGVTATAYNPSTTTAALITATAEWQVCFKCHSGANANVATWGGAAATAAAFTDLALEFNPNNASRHPVVSALPVASQLTAAKLTGGWVPGSVMTCSDCHATDSAASKGPHGSSVKWMLAGTNKAWPYTTAAGNGTSTGTLYRIATYNTGAGTKDGLFCLNCHTVRPATGVNNWHSNSNVTGGQHGGNAIMACASCHLRVPHGGKISRLLQTTNVPARYRSNGSTATSSWDFWGTSTVNIKGSAFASGNFNSSCGQHNSGGSGGEAW